MNIQGVIFDLDGVLVTTDEYHYLGWKRLADDLGIAFTREDNRRQRGVSRMESLEILLAKGTRTYTQAEKDALAAHKNRYYVELLQNLTPADVLPGARDLLEDLLRRNLRLAVGSSSRNTPFIMQKVELCGYFNIIVDGNSITRSKPDPEVFLLAANRLELAPESCVVIEDAEAGVAAAKAAGMHCIGIGDSTNLGMADIIVASLSDITPETVADRFSLRIPI